ncbi:MAG TPA: TolC family protein [Polyangiaceae bacterium]|nr:TolC family protein [Polyangiaceae bacterium]
MPASHSLKAAVRFGALVALLALTGAAAGAEEQPPRVLGLDDAVAAALQNQPTVLVARAQTEAAAGRVEQARSGYLPQVTGNALYERVHGSTASATSTTAGGTTSTGLTPVAAGGSATYDLFSAGISATQLIWDFGQTIDRTKAAAASRDAQQSSERSTKQQVVLQVRRTFFQAHAQKALVIVGNESVGNQERHLAQIRGFVEQGIRPEIDLAQARTDLANAKVTLINARTNYVTAKAQLNQAMGVQGPLDFEVSDDALPGIAEEDQPIPRLVAIASESRPELVALLRQRRAAELTLSAIHGAYGPSLSALGGISETGVALDALGTRWNVGLSLNWPLFQGGLTAGQSREARANIDAAAAQITAEQLQIRVEVEQAELAIQSAKVVIEAAKDATTNAHEQLRLAEGRYESGVGSIIELDDAQLAVQSAEAQSVQAEFNLALARAQLLSALGR